MSKRKIKIKVKAKKVDESGSNLVAFKGYTIKAKKVTHDNTIHISADEFANFVRAVEKTCIKREKFRILDSAEIDLDSRWYSGEQLSCDLKDFLDGMSFSEWTESLPLTTS